MNPPRTISWKEVTFLLWLTPVNLWHLPTILPSTSPRLFMSLKSRFCTFYRLFGQKLSCYLGSATAWARFAMGFGSVSLHQMEFWVHLYEINLEVRSCNPTSSCKWRVSVHEVLGKQIIRISFFGVSFFLIVLHFQANVKLGQTQVDLLQNICAVLEPFYQATLQLSNDAACISEVNNIWKC